jgi:fatty-acyl-CoA synthase
MALVYEDQRYTYRDLYDRVVRLAHALRSLGVRAGDRVGVLGPNHPAHLETLFACGLLGAISVPLHARFSGAELTYAINDSACSVLIFMPQVAATVDQIRAGLLVRSYVATSRGPAFALDYEQLLSGASSAPIDRAVGPDDICIINYTSGTTGNSKGVTLTHQNIIYNVFNFLSCSDYVSDDVMLTVMPLYRIGGIGTMLPVFFKGGTIVLLSEFNAERVLELVEEHRVTFLFNGPKQFEAIARSPRFARSDLSSLRWCMCGGDVVPESLIRVYLERGVTFQQAYGLTEGAPLALLLDKSDVLEQMGSAGVTPLFTEVKVVREDLTEVAPGEVGELLIRGPNVTVGYWERPDLNAEAFSDGWLHTGDAVTINERGFVTLVDRVRDAMMLEGHKVYPAQIERVLASHPTVLEAAVIEAPVSGVTKPVACVVARPGVELRPDELISHCAQRLPAHCVPAQIQLVPDLPRNVNAKLMRRRLREMWDELSTARRTDGAPRGRVDAVGAATTTRS